MNQVIVAQKGVIKKRERTALENAGYIVLVVDNVDAIKMIGADPVRPTNNDDDGFDLNGTATH